MASPDFNNMEEIDLLKLVKALWRKAWIIVLVAIVFAGGAFYWSYSKVTTKYKSSALLYVNNNSLSVGSTKLSISSGDILAANNLMDTYSVILKSRNTLQDIITETELNYTYEQLVDMISSEPMDDTAVFKVMVTADDPNISAHVANSILAVLPEKISSIVEGSSVQIIEYAVPGEPVVDRNPVKDAAIGGLLGMALTCAVVILQFLLDTKIRNEDYLLDAYKGIPILTTVPDLSEGKSHKGGYYGYSSAYAKSRHKAQSSYKKAAAEAAKNDSLVRPGNKEGV